MMNLSRDCFSVCEEEEEEGKEVKHLIKVTAKSGYENRC